MTSTNLNNPALQDLHLNIGGRIQTWSQKTIVSKLSALATLSGKGTIFWELEVKEPSQLSRFVSNFLGTNNQKMDPLDNSAEYLHKMKKHIAEHKDSQLIELFNKAVENFNKRSDCTLVEPIQTS